jgi:integrase
MRRIKKRKGRSYEIRVRDASGWRWVSTGTHDKIAAQAHLRDFERRAADPAYNAETQATTEILCRDYLTSRRARGRSAGTLDFYRKKFGALIRLLPQDAAALTHSALEAYIDTRSKEVSSATVKKELTALGAALSLARKNGRFSRDPATIIPELADTSKAKTRYLQPAELVALANTLPPHRAAHVVWIVATGCRWSESLRARREDIGADTVWIRGTKTGTSADHVPILDLTRPLLAWALERATGRTTLHLQWHSVRRDLAAACKALGLAPVTPNDLRRTLGTWLRQRGAEPALVGQMLRHTDSRMAEKHYARLDVGAFAKVLESRIMVPHGSQSLGPADTPGLPLTLHIPGFPGNSVPRDGIEPPTRGFSIPCSTN